MARKDNQKRKSNRALLLGMAAGGLAAYYALVQRPRMLTWGATSLEASRPLPGDGLILRPNFETTRAVTVIAAAHEVWPWVVQIGYERGGFYSYDALEREAGLEGLKSADRVMPELQNLQKGDTVMISPVSPMRVALIEPNRALVLHMLMDPNNGQAMTERREPFFEWTWAFVLEPLGAGATRLIARVRAEYQPKGKLAPVVYTLLEPAHYIMERKMLATIKERVEQQEA